jgi:hypothetical protein
VIKTIGDAPETRAAESAWLSLATFRAVSVSSEDAEYPIEDALRGMGRGWRASTPGVQRLGLQFVAPTVIRLIRIVCEERSRPRTQELALDWLPASGATTQNVVRQQFMFAPPGTSVETEEYATDLPSVIRLELTIVPDISDPTAVATLTEWRVR